jgi:(5-formylfuran-3-yl)methyl phosphate synthase
MRLLVSVRNLDEARLAAAAGVDFIDLKDPAAGALGALPPARIAEIVCELRGRPAATLAAGTTRGTERDTERDNERAGARATTISGIRAVSVISATTGDLPSSELAAILAQVQRVAATGVDLVKVGIDSGPASAALLAALARCPAAVVPVLMADHGVDMALVHTALALGAFPALMLDTAEKVAGSLLQRRPLAELQAFIDAVRAAGPRGSTLSGATVNSTAGMTASTAPGAITDVLDRTPATAGRSTPMAGLAGALRREELPALRQLGPDFAGFRSAVCSHGRAQALDPLRLAALCSPATERAMGSRALSV